MKTTEYKITQTLIPGLLDIDITRIEDERGWFQEKYQKEKLVAAGFPDAFIPLQQNISYNKELGVTRGLHAEPWDKYVSVIKGKVFGVWVDLRPESFGKVYSAIIDERKALYIPKGVANGYQTLESDVYYSYLVNDHWTPQGNYKAVNVWDPQLKIDWPRKADTAIVSAKDLNNPLLKDINPF